MAEKTCVVCRKAFETKSSQRKCCPGVCSNERKRMRDCQHRQTPKYKEREWKYKQTPEWKANDRKRKQTPEYKEWAKKYRQTPEYKERKLTQKYRPTPEYKERRKEWAKKYRQTPESKEWRRNRHRRQRELDAGLDLLAISLETGVL